VLTLDRDYVVVASRTTRAFLANKREATGSYARGFLRGGAVVGARPISPTTFFAGMTGLIVLTGMDLGFDGSSALAAAGAITSSTPSVKRASISVPPFEDLTE
jgi:hypothetical protein